MDWTTPTFCDSCHWVSPWASRSSRRRARHSLQFTPPILLPTPPRGYPSRIPTPPRGLPHPRYDTYRAPGTTRNNTVPDPGITISIYIRWSPPLFLSFFSLWNIGSSSVSSHREREKVIMIRVYTKGELPEAVPEALIPPKHHLCRPGTKIQGSQSMS